MPGDAALGPFDYFALVPHQSEPRLLFLPDGAHLEMERMVPYYPGALA